MLVIPSTISSVSPVVRTARPICSRLQTVAVLVSEWTRMTASYLEARSSELICSAET
jgi:hypothetical protein